jgi:hypothetical protein
MTEGYLGISGKKLVFFAGTIMGAVILVTLAYWSVFGFDRWSRTLSQSASLMLAAAPMTYQGQASPAMQGPGQYVCPTHGAVGLPSFDAAGVPHCPVCNQMMCFNSISSAPGYVPQLVGGG